jgi:hypothetical protein
MPGSIPPSMGKSLIEITHVFQLFTTRYVLVENCRLSFLCTETSLDLKTEKEERLLDSALNPPKIPKQPLLVFLSSPTNPPRGGRLIGNSVEPTAATLSDRSARGKGLQK